MRYRYLLLVGRVGIEPTTIGLKDRCSTTELPAHACEHYNHVSVRRNHLRLPDPLQFIAYEDQALAHFNR
jgi:hypothetical protein